MALLLVIVLHLMLFILLLLAIPLLILKTPWYISVPLCTWIIRLPTVQGMCIITELESKLRIMLGKPPIKSFIKQNILRNYAKFKRYIKSISGNKR